MHTKPPGKSHWYQYPLVWLVIAIPAASVIMGGVVLYLAATTDSSLVVDDYYKRGKAINLVLVRDEYARRNKLSAGFYLRSTDRLIRLQLDGADRRYPSTLKLLFAHPTRKKYDRRVTLRHLGNGLYQAPKPALHRGRWYIQLETAAWRLLGRISLPYTGKIVLAPAEH